MSHIPPLTMSLLTVIAAVLLYAGIDYVYLLSIDT